MSTIEFIAEAGVNHNGSLDVAARLIEAAAQAGADFVKFQTFTADDLVTADAGKAPYQKKASDPAETQYGLLKKLELDVAGHRRLIEHCRANGIEFLSSPFAVADISVLTEELGLTTLKLPSGAITDGPFLLAAARSGARLILSTGMATLAEVRAAVSVIAYGFLGAPASPTTADLDAAFAAAEGQRALRQKLTVLQCTTAYPTPMDEANLLAMKTLANEFGVRVGYSDPTLGTVAAIAATGLGARVIEKHFTLDRAQAGPDHAASVEPDELRMLVDNVRAAAVALGRAGKEPTPTEQTNIAAARKSLVASGSIARGEKFSADNLTAKRPGTGISPMRYWEFLGQRAGRDYQRNELIDE